MANSQLYLSNEQYTSALKRQRDRIEAGLPLKAEDSNTIGNKFTECSWGLCSHEPEAWPNREDHLWPDQFDKGRIAPKYRQLHQRCPLDKRTDGSSGCFYTCRIFQDGLADKAKALQLYDEQIIRSGGSNSADPPPSLAVQKG